MPEACPLPFVGVAASARRGMTVPRSPMGVALASCAAWASLPPSPCTSLPVSAALAFASFSSSSISSAPRISSSSSSAPKSIAAAVEAIAIAVELDPLLRGAGSQTLRARP